MVKFGHHANVSLFRDVDLYHSIVFGRDVFNRSPRASLQFGRGDAFAVQNGAFVVHGPNAGLTAADGDDLSIIRHVVKLALRQTVSAILAI